MTSPGQPLRQSALEAMVNTLTGFPINAGVRVLLWGALGYDRTVGAVLWIDLVVKGVATVHEFIVRRVFNAVHVQGWASLWVWWQNALALVPAVCAG